MEIKLAQEEIHQNTYIEKGHSSSQRNRNWLQLVVERVSIKQVKSKPEIPNITMPYSKIEKTVNSYFHRISSD